MIQYALSRTAPSDRGSRLHLVILISRSLNHARAYSGCLSGDRRTLYAVDASDRASDRLGVYRRLHIRGHRSRCLLGTRRRRRKGHGRGHTSPRARARRMVILHRRHDVEGRARRVLGSRRHSCGGCGGSAHRASRAPAPAPPHGGARPPAAPAPAPAPTPQHGPQPRAQRPPLERIECHRRLGKARGQRSHGRRSPSARTACTRTPLIEAAAAPDTAASRSGSSNESRARSPEALTRFDTATETPATIVAGVFCCALDLAP